MKFKAKQELKSQEKVLRFASNHRVFCMELLRNLHQNTRWFVAYCTTESKTMVFHLLYFMLQSHPEKVENSIHTWKYLVENEKYKLKHLVGNRLYGQKHLVRNGKTIHLSCRLLWHGNRCYGIKTCAVERNYTRCMMNFELKTLPLYTLSIARMKTGVRKWNENRNKTR